MPSTATSSRAVRSGSVSSRESCQASRIWAGNVRDRAEHAARIAPG